MEASKTKALMFFVFLSLLSITSCSAFNITNLLNKKSDFSTFNKYLSATKLADDINKRSTITVLALNNDAMGGISSDNSFPLKSVMSVHVILDYYDKEKLTKMAKNNSSIKQLTTLFQSSGEAKDQQGFVRVKVVDGEIYFGSASKGAEMNSKMVRLVTAQPYNISVLEVGSIIRVPDINGSPAPEKAPGPKKGKSPRREYTAESPADEEDEAPGPAPPKRGFEDDVITAESPLSTPTLWDHSSDARATAAEIGFGAVAIGLASVLVAFF